MGGENPPARFAAPSLIGGTSPKGQGRLLRYTYVEDEGGVGEVDRFIGNVCQVKEQRRDQCPVRKYLVKSDSSSDDKTVKRHYHRRLPMQRTTRTRQCDGQIQRVGALCPLDWRGVGLRHACYCRRGVCEEKRERAVGYSNTTSSKQRDNGAASRSWTAMEGARIPSFFVGRREREKERSRKIPMDLPIAVFRVEAI